ncbi:MAG TPA: peptidylprolyl isomerase [Prolixibacteraceae bacterium]|nr:peptidylprolyl isomerase [Prolixibacteraceae bacterium]
MKKIFSLLVLSLAISTFLSAQKNTIVTIDGRQISKEEFEAIYKKNNSNLNDHNDVKSPKEYMEMFIDFKLKVIEAENRGLDTTQAFKNELKEYRTDLAKPYLANVVISDSLLKETYRRSVTLAKASHILIKLPDDPTPEDTLKAYNKIIEIRNLYLKGEPFNLLAKEYSEDHSAKEDGGEIAYFSAFKMYKAFEDAAYTCQIGEITMPIRTKAGYHILLIEGRKPSQGEFKVAHIMKQFMNIKNVSPEEDAKNKAFMDSIYTLLQNGADFADLARKYSDDRGTSRNGGDMSYISEEFAIIPFAKAAFSLKNVGDFSEPVRTKYGWHIVKLLDKKPVPTFDEMKEDLLTKLKSDNERVKQSNIDFIERMKKEYGYVFYDENFNKYKEIIQSLSNDTIYEMPEGFKNLAIFHFAGKDYTADEHFNFIKKTYGLNYNIGSRNIKSFDSYIKDLIASYEDSRLEEKYPEFRYLMKEYHDGILLFSIMEKEVWNKAVEDSVGLEKYYEQNKGRYEFGEHFDGLLITCVDQDSRKLIEKSIEEGITTPDSLMAIANNHGEKKNVVVKGRWEKGSNHKIDYLVWHGEKPEKMNEELEFVSGSIKNGGAKTLDEARGLYISDYQSVIEKEWIKQLRSKYSIQVNEPLLRKVKTLKKGK